jgi:flagellar biosynthesis protein FliQ
MTPAVAADLFRAMLLVALRVGAPFLGMMTVTAVLFGVIQAATQVQDAAVSFTPKLAIALVVG